MVDEILNKEWDMFISTNNVGGPADCQQNKDDFIIMRSAQWKNYPQKVLESYINDLREDIYDNVNTVQQKYLYMMEFSEPDAYEKIKYILRPISNGQKVLIRQIEQIYMKMGKEFFEKFTNVAKYSRPLTKEYDIPERASFETYLHGELQTYSSKTLIYLLDYLKELDGKNENIVYRINNEIAIQKGYENVEELERILNEL